MLFAASIADISRRRMLFGLVVATLPFALAGCKQEVRLTGTPLPGLRPPPTVPTTQVFLDRALPLESLRAAAERALPDTLAVAVTWLDAGRCRGASDPRACARARVDVKATRAGSVRLRVAGHRLAIDVPTTLTVRTRTAAGQTDSRDETVTLSAAAALTTDSNLVLSLRHEETSLASLRETMVWGIAVDLDIAPAVERRLSAAFHAIEAALRAAIPAESLAAYANRAWQAMGEPIAVAGSIPRWLVLSPRRINIAGLSGTSDQAWLRLAIAADVRFSEGERPARPRRTAVPAIHTEPTADANTRIVVVRVLPYHTLEQALAAQLPPRDRFEAVVEKNQVQLAARPHLRRIYPAYDRIGVELQLDIDEPGRWRGRMATMHLEAWPAVQAGTGTLGFSRIEPALFAVPANRAPAKSGAANEAVAAGPLLLANAPLVRRLAGAEASIVSLLDGVERGFGMTGEHPLAGGFTLNTSIGHSTLEGVTPGGEGLEVRVVLTGLMRLEERPTTTQQVRGPQDGRVR